MKTVGTLLLSVAVTLTACDDDRVTVLFACDDIGGPTAGIAIRPVDARTGALITNVPISVTVRDGSYTESLTRTLQNDQLLIGAAYNRIGTYRVDITAPGFQPFTRTGLRVQHNGCAVVTVLVTAELQRTAP